MGCFLLQNISYMSAVTDESYAVWLVWVCNGSVLSISMDHEACYLFHEIHGTCDSVTSYFMEKNFLI